MVENTIGNSVIPAGDRVYIIAEMSANHGGDYNRAIEIIHEAKKAGADCVKIQTYTADTMTLECDNKYFRIESGKWAGETLYNLYSKAYTPWEWHKGIKEEVERLGMDFLSTPFDKSSVDFLDSIGVNAYKIASFELTDIPLIGYIASKNKPIIMSTGMGTFDEIQFAVNIIRDKGINEICLLKCSSAYPAITDEMNLRTMQDMKEKFNVNVGLSDHSMGHLGAVAAVAMGAKVIEKHFCLSREFVTADSSFSMEPKEFREMVDTIKVVERAMGKPDYRVGKKEKENLRFRRSIFVAKDIKKGERFSEENIRIIRPSYGIEPKYYIDVIGKKANVDIAYGTPLRWGMISD